LHFSQNPGIFGKEAFMGVNRQLKDSVFSFLFSDPVVLRGLYSALEGVDLAPDVPISVNTLTDVLFKDQINDLSFTVDNRLVVLIEHQSTINPNMPLRLLKYIARVYEKIAGTRKLSTTELVPIPWPEFIVLYNGTDPYPDQVTLKLSDAFTAPGALPGGAERPVALELMARVYNINHGHNEAMLKKCEELSGYSTFIDKVREYAKAIPDENTAFRKAINDCIEHNVLKEFLELHATEVLEMLLTEWSTEEWGAARWEEGMKEGEIKGELKVLELVRQGYTPEQIEARLSLTAETGDR
jgi:hypothetical protein